MTFGVTISAIPGPDSVGGAVSQAREAEAAGLASVWWSQLFATDALTMAALAGRETNQIEIGTAVVPVHPRHPLVIAQQALTAQAASHGRFTLGLGLSNPGIADTFYGVPWKQPIRHLREHLAALQSALSTGEADVNGETLTAVTPVPIGVAGAEVAPPVLIGAVGPQALRVAGELADGAIALHITPDHLADSILSPGAAGASHAGRPHPRLVAAVPVMVTSEPREVRAVAGEAMAFYSNIPSWAALLERQGLRSAADLAIIGDEEQVAGHLRAYLAAGATDITAIYSHLGGEESRRRTWALLGTLERASAREWASSRTET
jgi:F420-dependent oxidoreductase-like protein